MSKKGAITQIDEQWKNEPVSMETIDAAGIAALAKNNTKKLRLINVWATWCVPCVKEFPSLVSISRRLNNRDFELITISADDPKDEAKARQFLERQHAAIPNRVKRSLKREGRTTNNYLFTGTNTDGLMQALDPAAPGPVPYTLVIAPGGKIIYRHSGEVNAPELLAKLVENLGPYYSRTKN
jgi:thiol-disulfide isomerase/thioredoxin